MNTTLSFSIKPVKKSLRALILITSISFISPVFASNAATNTFSFLLGGEQDFRNMDHATYLTAGAELNNFFNKGCYYFEIDNLVSGGVGDYYILNNYSVSSTYPSNMYKYAVRVTGGWVLHPKPDSMLVLGVGAGYRYLRYKASYDEQNITTVINRYIEFFFPIEINYTAPLSGDYSFSFNNIIPIGIHGKMSHIFYGSGGFTQPSFHDSFGISSSLLLNYKRISFGPWASYDYLTTGFFGGHPTVTSGNQLKIVEFGLKLSANF